MGMGMCGKCKLVVKGKLVGKDGLEYKNEKITHVECYPKPTNLKQCRFCHADVGNVSDEAGVEWRLQAPEHILCSDEYEYRKINNMCEYCGSRLSKSKCPKCAPRYHFSNNPYANIRRFKGYQESKEARMKDVNS